MVLKKLDMRVSAQEDVVAVRQATRSLAVEIGLSIIDQTKIVTAASELARNTVLYGGGGVVTLEVLNQTPKQGLRLTFEDSGPGIPDLKRAMQDGYSSRDGLGLGLGGAKRLCSEFSIRSQPGVGTRIVVTRWKS
jgi:serine/threonine-protein kinase RsbT